MKGKQTRDVRHLLNVNVTRKCDHAGSKIAGGNVVFLAVKYFVEIFVKYYMCPVE